MGKASRTPPQTQPALRQTVLRERQLTRVAAPPGQGGRMAHLYQELNPVTKYFDKKSGYSKDKWFEAVKVSRTLYIGNMSFFTTEERIIELFSKCGEVKKVTMGLNKFKKSPC